MHAFKILGFLCLLTALVDSNPVPNPGMTGQKFISDFFPWCSHEGEGCSLSTQAAGADATWIDQFCLNPAKCGEPPPVCCGTYVSPRPSPAVLKRSFKRACRRAIRFGSTRYHGHEVSLKDFPENLIAKLQREQQSHRRPLPSTPHRAARFSRLSIMHWNPGGMAQHTFQDLKQWLQQHPSDIVVITETKWGFTSCWQDPHWSYIHSASTGHRTGGILIMVARHICHPDNLGYDIQQPGRLVHVRIHFDRRALDLVAMYQYVDNRNQASSQARAGIWSALNACLYQLPSRNSLLVAGDFNCSLKRQVPWTGTDSYRWKGQRVQSRLHADHEQLMQILSQHALVDITAWDETQGPTYIHGDTSSRIDHVFTRLSQCDGISKQAQFLQHADILPINQTHHIPIRCTIKSRMIPYQVQKQTPTCTYAQRAQCRRARLQESSQWTELHQAVCQAVRFLPDAETPDAAIIQLHDRVSQTFQRLFPKVRPDIAATTGGPMHALTETKWRHRQCIRTIAASALQRFNIRCIQAWYHWSRCRILQRQQQRKARQLKAARFQELCNEVDKAATANDAHTMFQIIGRFSPKRPYARARLRTAEGQIASQHVAHAITVQFVRETWQGPMHLQMNSERAPGVPFDQETLTMAIAAVHSNKTVAQPFLPALIWKSSATQIAQHLYPILMHWWSQNPPIIPACWRDSWLYFLPKPGKTNTSPAHLRPISLMEPLGKIVIGILTNQLKHHVLPRLVRFPHFGFLPQRSAVDAICRVGRHNSLVRSLVGAQRRTVCQRMEGIPKLKICGGISLYLDMTRAFDSVNEQVCSTTCPSLECHNPY